MYCMLIIMSGWEHRPGCSRLLSEQKMDEERKLKDRGQREETVATVLVTILMRIIGRSLNKCDDNNNNLYEIPLHLWGFSINQI